MKANRKSSCTSGSGRKATGKRVLFVCYGNSCRSQMAEAWARHYGRSRIEAASAGIHPLGHITEETEQVMAERGLSMAAQHSKGLSECDLGRFDVIVNLSGLPLAGALKNFSGEFRNWPVDDPYGDDLATYRRVRDEIEERVQVLVRECEAATPHPAPTRPQRKARGNRL